MTQSDHFFPMQIHAEDDEQGDEIGDDDVRVQEIASHVADGEYAENIPLTRLDELEVEEDVDGD